MNIEIDRFGPNSSDMNSSRDNRNDLPPTPSCQWTVVLGLQSFGYSTRLNSNLMVSNTTSLTSCRPI